MPFRIGYFLFNDAVLNVFHNLKVRLNSAVQPATGPGEFKDITCLYSRNALPYGIFQRF